MSAPESLDRLSRQDLFLAQIDPEKGLDVVRVPQLDGEQTIVQVRADQIGHDRSVHPIYDISDDLATLDAFWHGRETGEYLSDTTFSNLETLSFTFGDKSHKAAGLDKALKVLVDGHAKIEWGERLETAEEWSKAIGEKVLYVVARDMRTEHDLYAARLVRAAALRKRNQFAVEPVVTTGAGTGLLPKNFLIGRGIYAPIKRETSAA